MAKYKEGLVSSMELSQSGLITVRLKPITPKLYITYLLQKLIIIVQSETNENSKIIISINTFYLVGCGEEVNELSQKKKPKRA